MLQMLWNIALTMVVASKAMQLTIRCDSTSVEIPRGHQPEHLGISRGTTRMKMIEHEHAQDLLYALAMYVTGSAQSYCKPIQCICFLPLFIGNNTLPINTPR